MQATEFFSHNPLAGPDAANRLAERIRSLGREIPRVLREPILELLADSSLSDPSRASFDGQAEASGADADESSEGKARTPDQLRDVLSTRLMEVFRENRSRGCFGLLYELNGAHLLAQVASRLRRYSSKSDPGDVLQEVFFNVYRYPHRFDATRDDAFRVWSAMIVRNTVLKHLRSLGRGGRQEVPFEDLSDQPVASGQTPLTGVLRDEESRACGRAYVTYLQLYLTFYRMLSDRERRALHLVEVQRSSYRAAADELEIKLENLKMVIFRSRRKIHRAMHRVFEGLPPDCRPARDPARDPARHDPAPHDPAPHDPAPHDPAPHDPNGPAGASSAHDGAPGSDRRTGPDPRIQGPTTGPIPSPSQSRRGADDRGKESSQ